jgi:hypothetical protein
MIRQRDVHRVDFAAGHAFVELFVRVEPVDAVLASEEAELLFVAGDERRENRASFRVSERGQHGHLRDVAESQDGVTNLLHDPTRCQRCALHCSLSNTSFGTVHAASRKSLIPKRNLLVRRSR